MTPPGLLDGKRRALFAGLVGLSLVQAAALAAAAVATRAAFAALHIGAALPWDVIAVLGGAGVASALSQFAFRTLGENLGQDYVRDVRLALFDHASQSEQSALDRRRLGYHLLRFTGDLTALMAWPGVGLPRVLQAAVLLPAALAVLAYLDPLYGGVGLAAVCPTVAALLIWRKTLLRRHQRLRSTRARLAADITERLPVAPQLAALGRRQTERRRIDRMAGDLAKAAQDRRWLSEGIKAIPEGTAALAACALIALGSQRGVPAATVAAALAALALTIRPLRNIMAAGNSAAAFHAAHGKLCAALTRPVPPACDRQIRLKSGRPVAVEIKRAGAPPVRVNAGGLLTLPQEVMEPVVRLMSGTSQSDSTLIYLNGHEIRHLTPGSLRRSVGVVTNAPLLLKGSIRRAITLGLRRNPSDAEIMDRITKAGLARALDDLGGLNRRITERGADLTLPQREMISVLRVCLQRPGVVLFVRASACHAGLPFVRGATRIYSDPAEGRVVQGGARPAKEVR